MLRGLSEEVRAQPHFGLVHALREGDADRAERLMPDTFSTAVTTCDKKAHSLFGLYLDLVAYGFR